MAQTYSKDAPKSENTTYRVIGEIHGEIEKIEMKLSPVLTQMPTEKRAGGVMKTELIGKLENIRDVLKGLAERIVI